MSEYEVYSHADWVKHLKKVKLSTGITMAYMELGDPSNPPLIIAHGFSDNSRSTRAMDLVYVKHFHIFAIDERGHGQTDKPEQFAYTSRMLGEDIIALADALGLDRFYLDGRSMGSMASQYVAFSYPDRVIKLALLSSMCWFRNTAGDLKEQLEIFHGYETRTPDLIEELPTSQTFPDQEFGTYFYEEMKQWPLYCRLAAWNGMQMTDNRRFLQFIKAPTIVIWGSKDGLVTKDYREEFMSLMPDARYIVLEGCSHEIQQEQPYEVAQYVTDFMLGTKEEK